jgi:CBS domain-containing protein
LLLLTIGIAASTGMDVILATMSMGFALTNLAPRRSRELFETVRGFAIPIYVLFFVFVGARLGLSSMEPWLWAVVAAYVVCRSVGKIAGAYLGARATRSEPVVQKFLGVGLFAQGGVAVGLSIVASHHLQGISVMEGMSLGDTIIFVVTATTLMVQVTGPPLVKWVAKQSGEAGRNVTEDDIIQSLHVRDVMTPSVLSVHEADSVRHIVDLFSTNDQVIYPVVNGENRVVGTVSPDELKDLLTDRPSWEWIVALDVMRDTVDTVEQDAPLNETLTRMRDLQLEHLPVVESADKPRPVGMLSTLRVRKSIAGRLLAG